MARTITFEGRTVSVPDDATDAEIAAILQVPLVAAPSTNTRGYGEELLRQVGLTTRAGLEGVAAIPQMLGGAMEAVGVKGAGVNVGKQLADVVGLPSPQTDIEKVAGAGASAMAGGMPFLKTGQILAASPSASEVTKMVGGVMASQPAAQLGLSGVSGGASKAAEVGGLGAGAQLAAGIAAPIVAAPIAGGALALGRGAKNILSPLGGEAAAERGAARLAAKALGGRAEQAATALGSAADDVTAGQVAAAIDNADLAALQKLVGQRDATLTELLKKGTQAKLTAAKDALESRLSPVRDEALRLADAGGVIPDTLLKKVMLAKVARGDKTNAVIQNSMDDIERMILTATDEATGKVDPYELNTIRKNIKNLIEKHSGEEKQWDSKRTAALERQMQLAIDDAIESGIAKVDPAKKGIWSDQYMAQYREGMNKIRAAESGLEREIELATKGTPAVSKLISDSENPTKGLNLLSRLATMTNFALRSAEGTAGTRVEKKLAQMMAPSEFGGDKRRLAELMREEINRPKTMFGSMVSTPQQTRAELGYGIQEPAVQTTPTSRTVEINKDIPYSGLPQIIGAPPIVPGSWRGMLQPEPLSSPLPVIPDELLPLSQRYAGTNMPIGLVESGGPAVQNTPLPKLPPVERGLLGLSDSDMPIPDTKRLATRHDVPTMEFQLKAEIVDSNPQVQSLIAMATKAINPVVRQRALDQLKMYGIRSIDEAKMLQELYEGGSGNTRLQIEKTRGLR